MVVRAVRTAVLTPNPRTTMDKPTNVTDTTITPERLDELERLYGAATPGEWSAYLVKDNDGKQYATMYQTWAFVEPSVCGLWAGEGKDRKDLDFIVAARNTFPALLAAAEERDRLRERVKVIEAEALRRAAGVADQVHAEQNDQPSTGYTDGWLDAADIIVQRIEALITTTTEEKT